MFSHPTFGKSLNSKVSLIVLQLKDVSYWSRNYTGHTKLKIKMCYIRKQVSTVDSINQKKQGSLFFGQRIFEIMTGWSYILKLVSAIFYQICTFQQMKKLQKPFKNYENFFFISSKKLFSFSRYSKFCISVFSSFSPCQPLL